MMYFVYILECADDTLYVGITTDLKRRIEEHNHDKKGARYTRGRRPVRVVYSEECDTKSIALKRELEIKSWSRGEKLGLIGKLR
ncbi:GIY-YIG nuclease family protein [Candidatus Kaiserbacteria bacterium]|nr:GIY-YIG nuclease family protein [Candidatus Kaiserbacteria bacterium]